MYCDQRKLFAEIWHVKTVLPYFHSKTILNWEKDYMFSIYHKFMEQRLKLTNKEADIGWQALQWAAIYVEQAMLCYDNSRTA